MPSFVDESGTPSRRYPLPERYLVVGCITVPDEVILVDLLRDFWRQRGSRSRKEVKFSDLDHQQRLSFLGMVRLRDIRVDAAIVDKETIKTPVQRLKSGGLYRRTVALAITHSVRKFPTDHVTIDQYFNSRTENRQFISYLRQTVNGERRHPQERSVGDFSVTDSARSLGLQVADVVVGAIAYRYVRGSNVYRSLLETNLGECFWPENE